MNTHKSNTTTQATQGKSNDDTLLELPAVTSVMESGFTTTSKPLPKKLQHITASISYCRHTNVKIVIGTEFHNTKFGRRTVKSEHWVFALPLQDLLSLYRQSNTLTEKYLVMTALLVRAGLLDTTQCGLFLGDQVVMQMEKRINGALEAITSFIHSSNKFKLDLPRFRVTRENASNSDILNYIKHITTAIKAVYGGGLDAVTTQKMQSMEEQDLQRELQAIASNENNTTKYTPAIGKWALKEMALKNEELTGEQLQVIRYYLNCNDIDKLKDSVLEKLIPVVKTSLPYDDGHCRIRSLLVLKHLQLKLDTINKITASLGFITLREEKEYNALADVSIRKKVEGGSNLNIKSTVITVTNTKPTGANPLARLLNKFK